MSGRDKAIKAILNTILIQKAPVTCKTGAFCHLGGNMNEQTLHILQMFITYRIQT